MSDREIKVIQQEIHERGEEMFNDEIKARSKKNKTIHQSHKRAKLSYSKRYGTDVSYERHSCGCQLVVWEPTNTEYWFLKSEKDERYNFVENMIARSKALHRLMG